MREYILDRYIIKKRKIDIYGYVIKKLTPLSCVRNILFFTDFSQPISPAHSRSISLSIDKACSSLSSSYVIMAFCVIYSIRIKIYFLSPNNKIFQICASCISYINRGTERAVIDVFLFFFFFSHHNRIMRL